MALTEHAAFSKDMDAGINRDAFGPRHMTALDRALRAHNAPDHIRHHFERYLGPVQPGQREAKLQHRHYATIAAIIRKLPEEARERVGRHFAEWLAWSNPRFDGDRFVRACMG